MQENRTPYRTSTDYKWLYERLSSGDTLLGYIDSRIIGFEIPFRDPLMIELHNGEINGYVRGRTYIKITQLSVDLYNSFNECGKVDMKTLFLKECSSRNLTWVVP